MVIMETMPVDLQGVLVELFSINELLESIIEVKNEGIDEILLQLIYRTKMELVVTTPTHLIQIQMQ